MNAIDVTVVDAIVYRYAPRDWPFALIHADRIDAHWDELCARNGSALFNGRVLLAHTWALVERDGQRLLDAACMACDYKAFIAWRDFGFPDDTVRNLFAMAALRAADGAFMLGCMAGGTANAGRVYFPAGTPDMADVRGIDVDLVGSVTRELEEETGISARDVALMAGWTILFEGARIACMKGLRSAQTSAELLAGFQLFNDTQAEPELSGLEAVQATRDMVDARMPGFMVHYLRAQAV